MSNHSCELVIFLKALQYLSKKKIKLNHLCVKKIKGSKSY